MFKSAIASLTSAVIGTAKGTVNTYTPNTENIVDGAYSRIIQQGIANIAYRSPILSDIAQSTLRTFQTELIKKQRFNAYIKSEESKPLRTQISENLKNNSSVPVTDKKIDAEMFKVISKISDAIDKNGIEETRKSGKFKEYEKVFDAFKKPATTYTQQQTQSPQSTHNGGEEILGRIENNTQQTVNVLEELSVKGSLSGGNGGGNGGVGVDGRGTGSVSFIDPITGLPSIRAGIGSIGGSFLAKIFDEATIEKYANKLKGLFDPEESIVPQQTNKTKKASRPKRGGSATSVSEMFSKDLFELNKSVGGTSVVSIDNTKESVKERKGFTKISTENVSESAHEIEVDQHHTAEKLQKTTDNVVDELKKLNKATEKKSEDTQKKEEDIKPKVLEKPLNEIKRGSAKALSETVGKIVGNRGAGKLIGRVLSGEGGRVAGKLVGRVLGAGTVTEKALSAGRAMASYGSKTAGAVGAATEAAGAATLGAAARIGSMLVGAGALPIAGAVAGVGALGYGGYKLYQHVADKKPTSNISAAKTNISKEINGAADKKNKQNAAKLDKQLQNNQQSIILNNRGNVVSENLTPNFIGASVRNTESTFERVQMQDFWPRSA